MEPKFISVEGIDGVGKSTLVDFISEYLNKRFIKTRIVRQNRETIIGKRLRNFIVQKDEASKVSDTTFAFLFGAAINETIEEIIKPAMRLSKVVISDRYTLSTRVYQRRSAYVNTLCDILESMAKPDIVFVLDANVDVVTKRIGIRDIDDDVFEDGGIEEMNERRREFICKARNMGNNVHLIDASQDMSSVCDQVAKILDTYYADHNRKLFDSEKE